MQPIFVDDSGTLRFRANRVVEYLLDNGGLDMNALALAAYNHNFSNEDRQQFAQLIGYSLCGYGDLSYVTQQAYDLAFKRANDPEGDAKDQEIALLKQQIQSLRDALRGPMADFFGIHPDDLRGND